MTTAELTRYEINVEDVEYLRHGNKPFLARIYKPRGKGPFPLIIDLHGGAWCHKDRTTDVGSNDPLARTGVVVASLDFRQPPDDAGYPGSMADINYAIRWFKSKAAEYHSRPEMVALMGTSSGGHQAMLVAMRPDDPRYNALPLPGNAKFDATVPCIVLCWPVIDPLGRYQYAKKLKAEGKPKVWDQVGESHDLFWKTDEAMEEGNPTRALERGEKGPTPPLLYLQGSADDVHPRPHLDRFVGEYRKAGGKVELHFFEGMGQAFITLDPKAPQSLAAIDKIIEFVHRQIH